MFLTIVSTLFLFILFLAGGAVLFMGVFKAHKNGTGFAKKCISGVTAYTLSAVIWFGLYSYQHMGW